MGRTNYVGTSVRVERSILDRLEAIAERSRWSKGELHRQALEFYLPILERGLHLAPWHEVGEEPGEWQEADEEPGDWVEPDEAAEVLHDEIDDGEEP